ncbi:eukaryotic translation initiation factor SUI1 [Penicillium taxi]|uniref:eukaryotic translation initiation factor SUI1 n=1 Tax=Penicillium taxi TaxID=168475 RepID=UPI0025457935|nr:eukaryotic translation initiation factor SUI1 [Penicillium taxi]KAJ5884981.1 eukaryotic translation initiation factor SUI1 [Penicillium taxi]
MSIENFKDKDPFAEAEEATGGDTSKSEGYTHIRIQQRNGRKTLTTIQGLNTSVDPKKVLKAMRKNFACNGTVVTDAEMGEVIQLQGDQRKHSLEFLSLNPKQGGVGIPAAKIKVHGF